MAESQRKAEAAHAVTDDEAQKARDRRNLILFLIGGIIVVIIMVFISRFLSTGSLF